MSCWDLLHIEYGLNYTLKIHIIEQVKDYEKLRMKTECNEVVMYIFLYSKSFDPKGIERESVIQNEGILNCESFLQSSLIYTLFFGGYPLFSI